MVDCDICDVGFDKEDVSKIGKFSKVCDACKKTAERMSKEDGKAEAIKEVLKNHKVK